jgi:hypothetical protein
MKNRLNLPCRSSRLLLILGAALLGGLLSSTSAAQSLDAQRPAPLHAGANTGTVDNFGGANYFYFWSGPGETTITATFKSMGLFGNAMKSDLTIELYDEDKSWVSRVVISSLKESSQRQLHGSLKKETKLILAVIPPKGGLVRSGGDYEVAATGAVRFDKPLSSTDLIVGSYTANGIYDEEGAVKFNANGTLEFSSGTLGTWKLFDADTQIYTITYLRNRLSLKLIPGRGLADTQDTSRILFQRNR